MRERNPACADRSEDGHPGHGDRELKDLRPAVGQQLFGERGRAGQVGVDGREDQRDRDHGGDERTGRADRDPQQVGQRGSAVGGGSKDADRHDGQRDIHGRRDDERDEYYARELAVGIAEPTGHGCDRFPSDKGQHQHRRGRPDRRRAMRRERRPVVQPQMAGSADDRYRNERDEHDDQAELRRTRRPGAGEGHREHG